MLDNILVSSDSLELRNVEEAGMRCGWPIRLGIRRIYLSDSRIRLHVRHLVPKHLPILEMNRRTVLLTGANRQVQVDASSTAR